MNGQISEDKIPQLQQIKILEQSSTTTNEIIGDIKMQPIYLQRLLSIFCQLYQNTMILTIKRSTLRLISKLLH
jgi:hypothetical protein